MKKDKTKKLVLYVIILITIISFIYTIFEIINIYKKPENILDDKDTMDDLFSEDVNLDMLRKEYNNNDIVARLEIPNVFNILITQTDNNNFYLKYNIKKERDRKGTEFIDYRNSLISSQINIYGHNSKYYDSPFKKLEEFTDKDFFDSNEYILLQHSAGRRIYKIVAIKRISTDFEHMIISADNQKEHITKLLDNSIHKKDIEYTNDTNIIILQTCVINSKKNYYILIGFEI